VRPDPPHGVGAVEVVGSLEVFTDVDLAVDRGSRVVVLGLAGAGKTTLLRILAGIEPPDNGHGGAGGTGCAWATTPRSKRDPSDTTRSVLENVRRRPGPPGGGGATGAGLGPFSDDSVDKPAAMLSGGEKTRLALATLVVSSANVLLLDEPTNNLDPASRQEVLAALRSYAGAIALVTHDEGAGGGGPLAERVLLLPDGVEDHRGPADYSDLVAMA
jgi:ATPase subunit of ABC transporter with duplicated ATPase domains